jgi:hypothetical protein
MKQDSTPYIDQLRNDFHRDPVGWRVCLPDNSFAVVSSFQDTDEGRSYCVRGVHLNGRFRALDYPSCWFPSNRLRLAFYSASIREVAS